MPTDTPGMEDQIDPAEIDAAFGDTPTPEDPPAGDPPAADPPADPPAASPDDAPEPLYAPRHWPLEHRTKFSTVDRETQEWLLGRDKDMTATYTQKMQAISPFYDQLQRYKTYAEQTYRSTPEQVVDQLMQIDQGLRNPHLNEEQKIAAGLHLLEHYGIPLMSWLEKQTLPTDENGQVDPQAAEIHQLKTKLAQMEQQQQTGQQTAQYQQTVQAQQQVQHQFQTLFSRAQEATNEDGTPMFPHLYDVEQELEQLYGYEWSRQHFDASDEHFIELYDKATHMNAKVRDHLQGQQAQPGATGQPAMTKGNPTLPREVVQRKKAASASIAGGKQTQDTMPDDLDELVSRTYDQLEQAG